jgi:hypothetical protein
MNFDGTWQVTISTPIGKQSVVFEIVTQNGTIEGKATQGSEVSLFENLSLKDGHLTWTQKITKPMRLTLAFDVSLEEGKLRGTAKAGFLPSSSLVGERRI